nr:MAG TPA: hypothetical protein [Caudoviricetes sp.]
MKLVWLRWRIWRRGLPSHCLAAIGRLLRPRLLMRLT